MNGLLQRALPGGVRVTRRDTSWRKQARLVATATADKTAVSTTTTTTTTTTMAAPPLPCFQTATTNALKSLKPIPTRSKSRWGYAPWIAGALSATAVASYGMNQEEAKTHSESLRDLEFGVPKDRKRVDPFSPFFPSDKHPCTHAGMFIPGCHELKIFAGSSHFDLADDIARRLGMRVGKMTLGRFADGEVEVQIGESVRGKDVYLVQSLSNPVNDHIVELLLMVSTMRRASAKRVTVVIPYYAYKHHRRGSPISTSMNSRFLHSPASDIAKMLEVMGVDRVIAVDLQRPGQGHEACFFSSRVPVETLETVMAGVEYFATQLNLRNDVVILSPNSECLKKARRFELGLRSWLPSLTTRLAAYVDGGSVDGTRNDELSELVGKVDGSDVIIVDDIIDTCGTLKRLTNIVKQKGARRVYCFASHALLTSESEKWIDQSDVEEVVIMDTIRATPNQFHSEKVKRLSVAPMLSELIQAEHFKSHSYIDKESSRDDYVNAVL